MSRTFTLTHTLSKIIHSQVKTGLGHVEIIEICASVLGLLFLVGIFVCIRKRYVQQKKKKPACVQDSNG